MKIGFIELGVAGRPMAGRLIAASLLLSLGGAATTVAAQAPSSTTVHKATVTVDFGTPRGPLLRTERINNFASAPYWPEQRPNDVRFYNQQGLHGSTYRIWIGDDFYDPATGKFNYDLYAGYLDDASAMSDSILANFKLMGIIRSGIPPNQLTPILTQMIGALKYLWPRMRYVEAFNEPDYNFSDIMRPEQLYEYYVSFYRAVNAVNNRLVPKDRLKLGGPAFMMYNEEWMRAFLDGYKSDPFPDKRLDFISYHAYGEFPQGGGGGGGGPQPFHLYKFDPSEVAGLRTKLEAELQNRGLDKNIPSFITEMGLYPGPSFDDPDDPRPDYLRQAAGMPSYIYWFLENPNNVPFNWVLRHKTEERKDQLITRVGEGQPAPTGIFTPYGNQLLMMSKLKDERVVARSDALSAGKGVYAIATEDRTGAAVMVWNYQHVGTQPYQVTIDMGSLPPRLRHRALRQRMFRIDENTSNYWGDSARANLQQVDDRVVRPGRSYDLTVDLSPNALQLIVLEPASTNVSATEIGN